MLTTTQKHQTNPTVLMTKDSSVTTQVK